jgi:hypothetical protein
MSNIQTGRDEARSPTAGLSLTFFWKEEFGNEWSHDLDILLAMRDWEPVLLPRATEGKSSFFSGVICEDVLSVRLYTRRELAERTFEESKKNAEFVQFRMRASAGKPPEPSGFVMQTALPDAKSRENAIAFLVEDMLRNAPRMLCHPIQVTPACDALRSVLWPSEPDVRDARRIRAFLCTSLWWKLQASIPLAIRDLVWLALFRLCYGAVRNDRIAIRRSRMLLQCLMDSQWPMGVDNAKELIVLTF